MFGPVVRADLVRLHSDATTLFRPETGSVNEIKEGYDPSLSWVQSHATNFARNIFVLVQRIDKKKQKTNKQTQIS